MVPSVFAYSEFVALGIGVQPEMQRELLLCSFGPGRAAASGGFPASMLVCTHSPHALSDNSGAESGLCNLLTTSRPLAFFLARVSLLAAILRMSQAVSRIPGAANDKAATLSCPAEYALPPASLPHAEIRTCLQELWLPRPTISVSPPSFQLQWQVRARGVPTNLT